MTKTTTKAPFSPSSQLSNEEPSPSTLSNVENSSDLSVFNGTESVTANTMKNMPGIVDGAGNGNGEAITLVEEAELWQKGQQFSKQSSNGDGDIQKCANDVLNDILLKLDSNGLNQSLLSYLPLDNNELETSGEGEFVDAVGVFSDSLLTNNEENFTSELNNAEFCIKEEKLLEFSVSEDLKSSDLTTTSSTISQYSTTNIYDDLQSSTPINDDLILNDAKDSNVSNLINFNTSEVSDNEFSKLRQEENGEISFDSFETATSTMAEDRPISSKGQYSLADLEKLMSDDSAIDSLDPFGGRASTKNKTFTRKTTKQKDEVVADAKEDLNANDVDHTSNLSNSTDKNAAKSPGPVAKDSKQQQQQPDDVTNSNVDKSDVNGKDAATPKVEKRVVDDTPKKPKTDMVKRDVNSKPSAVQSGRAAGAQQTAVVAPMINKNESVKVENSASAALAAKPVAKPGAASLPATVPPPSATTKQDDSISDDEFVMASSDLFADPSALDYLQKAGSNNVVDSELYRQSLYVKFDPLVAEKMANKGAVVNAAKQTAKQTATAPMPETVTKKTMPDIVENTPTVHDETLTTEETDTVEKKRKQKDDLLLMKTPSPKVQAGAQSTPTCPPTVVLKKKPVAQARPSGEVDNMLAMSPKQQVAVDSEQPETSTQQLKMQFQAYILAKEKEWVTKFKEERDRSERLARELAISTERSTLAEKNASEMKLVVAEYDKTIRDLMRQLDKQKTNKHGDYDQILKEKDQALEDLQSVENAFSELHRRYEKLRGSTEDFKKNEEKLRECLSDVQSKLKSSEEKFRKLKEHAEEKLEAANAEIDRLQKAKESDTLALRALVKKRDLQVESLEKTLEQKQKEIQELSSICDELIQKVDYPQNTKSSGV